VRTFLLIVAVCAALTAAPAAAAASGPGPAHVSGTYSVTDFGAIECAPIGASQDLLRCSTTGLVSVYEGSLTGTSHADFTQIIDCARGFTFGSGVESFSGSVANVGSGTLTWRIFFRSKFDCSTFAVSDFSGLGVGFSGSGELADLNGVLRFGDVTYDGFLR
jgi:hypothetical protein